MQPGKMGDNDDDDDEGNVYRRMRLCLRIFMDWIIFYFFFLTTSCG